MTIQPVVFSTFILSLLPLTVSGSSHGALKVNEEYDYSILDPHSAHGTPYGGWSRATRSRLEALPLHLPPKESTSSSSDEDISQEEPLYMKVRDGFGQLYACRVYKENELEPSSFLEGMFDAPRVISTTDIQDETEEKNSLDTAKLEEQGDNNDEESFLPPELQGRRVQSNNLETAVLSPTGELVQAMNAPQGDITDLQKMANIEGVDFSASGVSPESILNLLALNTRLGQLQGVCGHFHLGWWSYEWCFEQYVSQFHVNVDPASDTLQVSDYTKLGEYHSRQIITDLHDLPANLLAQGETELGRIVEAYHGGDLCSETNKLRTSTVTMLCCAPDVMAKHKNKLTMKRVGDDASFQNEIINAAIHSVQETQVCTYDVIICTPLLCSDPPNVADNLKILSGTKTHPLSKKRPPKDNESVREILERTLGDVCLQTGTGGWWTYEFCHGNNIRQFHEEVGTRKTDRGATFTSRVVQSEHILGKYQADGAESYPNEDEWQHVINATINAKDGNDKGAYFEVEYTGGNVCDESDVTDRAIVAGGSGSGKKIQRSSSVRYFCGTSFFVSVSEDSTCHYIVEVTVPDLCNHPLFKAPVTMQQVIKCLPVDDDDEMEIPIHEPTYVERVYKSVR